MRRALLTAVVLAACLLAVAVTVPTSVADPTPNETAPPDPDTDVLGWENGYWHNESIDVDQSDGLSSGEVDRLLARTMARVERLRGLEFEETPRIEFVSPEGVIEYVDRNVTQLRGGNQTWEAMFVFGEDTDARAAVEETIRGSVAGMAAEEGVDHIVLVTADPDRPQVSGYVLAHELVHVLQDQHFDLSAPRYRRSTMDGELAKDGLVEGEASLVDGLYRRNCVGGEWTCLSGGVTSGSGSIMPAVARLMGVPYQEGASYASALRDRGGWEAVSRAHDSPPRTMKPVLHPDGETEAGAAIEYPDRSGLEWDRTEATQRIGEAGIRLLFTKQNRTRGVALPQPSGGDGPNAALMAPAEGWRNDTLYTYTNGTHEGYVWVTEWDSAGDAAEFAAAYRAVLGSYDTVETDDSLSAIPDGPFADTFVVRENGTRVTIGNAPDRDALVGLSDRFGVEPTTAAGADPTETVPATPRGTATTTANGAATTTATTTSGPGFGPGLAALAVFVCGCLGRQWL